MGDLIYTQRKIENYNTLDSHNLPFTYRDWSRIVECNQLPWWDSAANPISAWWPQHSQNISPFRFCSPSWFHDRFGVLSAACASYFKMKWNLKINNEWSIIPARKVKAGRENFHVAAPRQEISFTDLLVNGSGPIFNGFDEKDFVRNSVHHFASFFQCRIWAVHLCKIMGKLLMHYCVDYESTKVVYLLIKCILHGEGEREFLLYSLLYKSCNPT